MKEFSYATTEGPYQNYYQVVGYYRWDCQLNHTHIVGQCKVIVDSTTGTGTMDLTYPDGAEITDE